MTSFETRTIRSGMTDGEIRKFVGDFTDALVRLALARVQAVDTDVRRFETRFDEIGSGLDWSDTDLLWTVEIDPSWIIDSPYPHRTFMHPSFVTNSQKWIFVRDYLDISMVSGKASRVLFPNLIRRRRPKLPDEIFLDEAKTLNRYLQLVDSAGLTGDRIQAYRGDLKTHGQGQNDSGKIGAVGATVAILDALDEIRPGCVMDSHGTMPSRLDTAPRNIVSQMATPGYVVPRALLLSSHRAIIFSSDPDVAIISRIGGGNPYRSAKEASDEWAANKGTTAEARTSAMHQAALGEVKTAADRANMHERLALGSRENRAETGATRFLMMAIITPDIVDPQRAGRRAMFSQDAQRFQHVFNLYFTWGYDGARKAHPEHWQDFVAAIKGWTGL
jgi:hypothetical protein